jgi:hypothetical protein
MDPSRRNTNAKSSSPDYELGGFLGGGAAGVVYEAECARTKRSYAIKVNDRLLFTVYKAITCVSTVTTVLCLFYVRYQHSKRIL